MIYYEMDILDNQCLLDYKPVDGPEEKAIARLGVTYGVLRRVGFSEDRVQECLRNITGIDLEEAYDWVRMILFFERSGFLYSI